MLLLFVGQQRPDGSLGAMEAAHLAKVCEWDGEPDDFLKALLESKWLIRENDSLRLEGWERHGGKAIEERKKDRKRKTSIDVPTGSAGIPTERRGIPPHKGEGEGEGEVKDLDPSNVVEIKGGERARGLALVETLPASSSRRYSFDELRQFIQNSPNVRPLKTTSKKWKDAKNGAPYSQDEMEMGLAAAREAKGETNGGMVVHCILEARAEANKPPKMSSRGKQFKRAILAGREEVLKRFDNE